MATCPSADQNGRGRCTAQAREDVGKAAFVMQMKESGRPSSFQTEALFPGTGTPVPTGRAMPSSWGRGNTCAGDKRAGG